MSKREKMRRRLYFPQNTFWTIWLIVMSFKIIGLATFSVRNNMPKKKWQEATITFVCSTFGTLYNITLIGILVSLSYLSIPYRYYSNYQNKTILTTSIELLQAILGNFVVCTSLLSHCLKQTSLMRIGNDLLRLKQELRQLHHLVQSERNFYGLLVECVINAFLTISIFVTDVFAFSSGPISWLTDVMPAAFAGWVLIQYFLIVSWIETAFVDINRAIHALSRRSVHQTGRLFVSDSTIQPLLQLRELHNRLCEITTDVTQFYSALTLYALSLIFFGLVYNCYYLLTPLVMGEGLLTPTIAASTICWIISLLYPVALLTSRITRTTNEIEKTGNIVHTSLSYAIDQETKSELTQFSLQLLHRKVKFTAYGYFVLDNTLFHSIVSAVTTYLVILIQFHVGTSQPTDTSRNCTKL